MPTDKIFRTLPFGDFYYFGKILCSTFPRQKTHNRILIMEPHTHISQPTWRHFILLFPLYLLVRLWQATIRMRASDAKSLENLEDKKRLIGLAWHNRISSCPCASIFSGRISRCRASSARAATALGFAPFSSFLALALSGARAREGAHTQLFQWSKHSSIPRTFS